MDRPAEHDVVGIQILQDLLQKEDPGPQKIRKEIISEYGIFGLEMLQNLGDALELGRLRRSAGA